MSRTANISASKGTMVQEFFKANGNISIGENNLFQSCTSVFANKGDILIGNNNIFEENVVIINNSSEPMHIGNDNYFESGSYIDSSQIGDRNQFEPRSKIQPGCIIKNETVVSANCSVEAGTILEDLSVIYGNNNVLRKQFDQFFLSYHYQHIKYLRKIIKASKGDVKIFQ
ncbi:trimeric LpxA-like protein [Neoconidiobolus thromboides FSU 785]|nr:trimeric LpxA-like protein [Neoconidiobolus thromboides FSU 785]